MNEKISSTLIASDISEISEAFESSLKVEGVNLIKQISLLDTHSSLETITPKYLFVFRLTEKPVSPEVGSYISSVQCDPGTKTCIVYSFPLDPFLTSFNCSEKRNIRLVFIPDLFGPSITPLANTALSQFLIETISNIKKSSLSPSQEFSPIFQSELTRIAKLAMFSAGSSRHHFTIPVKPVNAREIAETLNSPIAFTANSPSHSSTNQPSPSTIIPFLPEPLFHFTPEHNLSDNLNFTIEKISRNRFSVSVDSEELNYENPTSSTFEEQESQSVTQEPRREVITPNDAQALPEILSTTSHSQGPSLTNLSQLTKSALPRRTKHSFAKTLLMGFASYALVLIVCIGVLALFAPLTLSSLKKGEYRTSVKFFRPAKISMEIARILTRPLFLIPVKKVNDTRKTLDTVSQISDEFPAIINLITKTESSISPLFSGFTSQSKATVFDSNSLIQNLNDLNLKLSEIEQKSNPVYLPPQYKKYLSQLYSVRTLLTSVVKVAPALPDLLGQNGRKTYLVLFQNNSELRPTGGFIGSVGLVTVELAKITDFQVYDVYSLDGQLKGHVEPPPSLKAYLGEAGWYLRDSNWDPDFTISAQRALWFLDKELGRSADGVIAVNLNVVKGILASLGPVELSDFGETISDKNLFERAEYQSENGFFPGSSNKKDFLGSLAKSLMLKVPNVDKKSQQKLLLSVVNNLLEKNILLYSPANAKTLESVNWDGGVKPFQCASSCIADYFLAVDANVGVNKVNYFTTREVIQKIDFLPTSISHQATINYHNRAISDSWPAGRYKNYLRIYLPFNALPTKIASVSQGQDTEITGYESFRENGFLVIGLVLEVPVGESKMIKIEYNLPTNFQSVESFIFKTIKQPGTNDTYSIELNSRFPARLVKFSGIDASSQSQTLTPGEPLRYNTPLTRDSILEVNF